MVGAFIGWTMTAQQAVLSNLPSFFLFPYQITLIVFGASILCGVASVSTNIHIILRRGIVSLMK